MSIGAVRIYDINMVEPKALKRCFCSLDDVFARVAVVVDWVLAKGDAKVDLAARYQRI